MNETLAMYQRHHVIGAFLVGLIVGLGAYYVWDNRSGTMSRQESEGNVATDTVDITAAKNSVTVSDQLAGFTANIDTVTLAQDGWIVVQEDVDGEPLYLLGASRRSAGTHDNVSVELLRNTEEGNLYYAVIYTDDGDRQFDNKKDFPVTNKDGNPIMGAFEIVRK